MMESSQSIGGGPSCPQDHLSIRKKGIEVRIAAHLPRSTTCAIAVQANGQVLAVPLSRVVAERNLS
jgi:hypothetical protein